MSFRNVVAAFLKNGVPRMSPETTDEEKIGRQVWRQIHGPTVQGVRARQEPNGPAGSTRPRRSSWLHYVAHSLSSSVVSGDISGTYPVPRLHHGPREHGEPRGSDYGSQTTDSAPAMKAACLAAVSSSK